ncbi:hypothetical protein BDV29DRAFT_153018 [Aspergillus leporis]|uniref:Uncharacterized protein n=1 Tax=Aspergillus leporis TaxID=41062 RepID=A0A5N5XEY8_9EURO|nr:hypothetical protein BDV29DRAFT_153018 [Aspergillus leporis]
MGQRSNGKHASKRQECREALANHIYERLNLHICPDQVRLKPSMEDGYAWSVSESKEYLLDTSLSRGSVGRYDIIMEELGRSIEAVTPASLQKTEALHTVPAKPRPETDSLTATIMRLKDANGT